MKPFIRTVGVIIGSIRAEYRQLAIRYFGKIEQFDGDAREISRQIIDRLWEGDFYRTSLGHFDFFWVRDFGTVSASLVRLGHADRVHHTLRWALRHFRRANIISTCIDKAGHCFQAPSRAIDTLPWLMHSIVVSGYPLNASDRVFLKRQLKKYRKTFLEPNGAVKKMKFAEMRDAVVYDRSAYAVSLVGRLAVCAEALGFDFFDVQIYHDDLLRHYWTGQYFKADRKVSAFSAEGALLPFFLGIIDDKNLADKTFDYISDQKLNELYPLIYTNEPKAFRYNWWMTTPWMPNYEGHTIWSWHGEFYLHLLKRYHRPEYAEQYQHFAAMMERHKTFPEMLNLDGSWYYAPIYSSDPGMIWCALFLELPPKI